MKVSHERMKAIIDFNSENYEEMLAYIEKHEKNDKLLELLEEYFKYIEGEISFENKPFLKLKKEILKRRNRNEKHKQGKDL